MKITTKYVYEARQRIKANPDTFVIDVQDSHDAGACGLIRGSALRL
ncbi:MAG: hypothetical protein ACQEXV_10950 [Bacillota bacterium]